MKKKGKIVGFMAAICCAIVLGICLGRTNILGKLSHNKEESTSEASDETNVVIGGQNQSFTSDINMDILSRHSLPALERMEKNDQDQFVNNLEVVKRVELLGIEKKDLLYPENQIANIQKNVSLLMDSYDITGQRIPFQGTTSEELQQAINENPNCMIDIVVDQIQLHDTITLNANTMINGNGVRFVADGLQFGFRGENVSHIYINDIRIEGNMDYGIYLVGCNNISISSCEINGMTQKAICIMGTTKGLSVCDNQMSNNKAGGLFIAGNVSDGVVDSNVIQNNGGTSNWMAGLVLTSMMPNDKYNIWEMFDEAHHFPHRENYHAQADCPHGIIVSKNHVMYNTASGIYSDGAYMCYVLNNTVYQNDKEGICMDYATIGFYLKENVVKENGRRARQTDEDLGMDFVLEAGKMEDGSAKAKLPGVSLDDTAYNIIENNIVVNNYGGGIKMVRTTVRTLIFENIVRDNNMGQNDMFHFFGIELGAAAGDVNGANTAASFMPDYENIICRNNITGNHYSGIFVGEECYVNDIFDNVIMEAQMFAVEAISKKYNSIVNNMSSAGIRNEYVK